MFHEVNGEGQSLSPLVPIPKTRTIDNFSQKYKQTTQQQQPPQHTTTLPQSGKQQNNQTSIKSKQPKSPENEQLKSKFNLQEIPAFKPRTDTER